VNEFAECLRYALAAWYGLFLIGCLIFIWNVAAYWRSKKAHKLTQDDLIDAYDGEVNQIDEFGNRKQPDNR